MSCCSFAYLYSYNGLMDESRVTGPYSTPRQFIADIFIKKSKYHKHIIYS